MSADAAAVGGVSPGALAVSCKFQLNFAQRHKHLVPTASISQDYWGDIKEDWESGGRKSPSGVRGGAPVGGLGDEVPQKLKLFCESTHNICIKIQQTTVAVTRVDILNDISSKILGNITMDVPPS